VAGHEKEKLIHERRGGATDGASSSRQGEEMQRLRAREPRQIKDLGEKRKPSFVLSLDPRESKGVRKKKKRRASVSKGQA